MVFDFENFTWEYKIDEFINKLQNILNNKLINENDLSIIITNLSNELLETLKIIENCASCKDEKIDGKKLDECLAELEREQEIKKKEDTTNGLNDELNKIDFELNKKVLCESCKEKKIEKLTDKYGNEEIARFLYECKLNAVYRYIRWIPFDEFKNIEYLSKGGFGEVHKATWINCYNPIKNKYVDNDVVLKRIYNSNDKIADILKEVR